MKNCGLPKGCEDQCCLNHSGMCTLDTAEYSEIDRATEMRGCGFIGVNDRYLLWKYGVPYKDFKCGHCKYYRGETHGECTNEQVKPHTKGVTVNGEKEYVDSKEYYSGAHACKKFIKFEEVKRVAKKKPTPEEILKVKTSKLTRSFADWNNIKEYGCNDPFWPDGSNMNLVHNHICYHKTEIEKLCSENNLELPEIYYKETPPEVDQDYMARADEIRSNAKMALEAYKANADYKFLVSNIDKLDKKQKQQTSIINVIGYASGLEVFIREDSLVDMRRHEKPERYLESFSECAEKVRALLPTEDQKCRVCGCTDSMACPGGCYWVEHDLCSACAEKEAESCVNCGADKESCQPYQACMSEGLEPEECVCKNWRSKPVGQKKIENACPYGKLNHNECRCINDITDGHIVCDAIRRKDWDRYHYVREMQGKVNCDIFDKLAAEIIAEKKPENQKNTAELPEIIAKSDEIVTFDYSTVDGETGAFLQEKANRITEIRFKSVIAIGKELKEAHDRLANNKTGTFEKWVESIGITHKTSRNYINGYEYMLKNFQHIEDAENIQPSLLFAASKPSAPKELSDKVASGDITTHKQYKELEKRLKEAEERAERVIKQKFVAEDKAIHALGKVRKSEDRQKVLEIQNKSLLRDYEAGQTKLKNLQQQLDQAKRNSDLEEVRELQSEIQNYQTEIGRLNVQLQETKQQLHSKPIEVAATKVVEKEIVPKEVAASVYYNVKKLYDGIAGLSEKEIQIFASQVVPEFYDDISSTIDEAIRTLEKIQSAAYDATTNTAEPDGHCGDCVNADMDAVTEEQLDDGKTLCTVTGKIVDIEHACSKYKFYGGAS